MKIENYIKYSDSLVIETSKGKMKLVPYGNGIIRVLYTLDNDFSTNSSMMIVSQDKSNIEWSVKEIDDELILATKDLQVVIDMQTCCFKYLDNKGNLLAKEPDKGGKTLKPIDVYKSVFDENKK